MVPMKRILVTNDDGVRSEGLQALAEALQLAKSFVERAATAVRAVKELLRAGISLPAEDAAMTERSLFPDLWAASEHLQASASFVARKNHKPRRD